ncbi:hypothetical protein VIN01S_19690 [Vibrio inusitatus NBRC 102082]|uniref:Uncharacterized protein n=1 Tax=Vibrio inusitatus NBRC 102082 TaxID=1219070 RepID=A0A4Y3HVY3_9VIBR|nr:hypothetical protein [Vibrio inusitatus]GEA51165.1 hypothetical protein VIN01S_19690 [Vibrio inusitatus NBRC 102082]
MSNIKFIFIFTLLSLSAFNTYAENIKYEHISDVVPDKYKISRLIVGDLTSDGNDEVILLIKMTDPKFNVVNNYGETVDRNKRGLIILKDSGYDYSIISENLDCFESENEDGGIYAPPEMSIESKNGHLYVHYSQGRYGWDEFNFRYKGGFFYLIGYESAEGVNGIIQRKESMNFLTMRKQTLTLDDKFDVFSDEGVEPETSLYDEKWETMSFSGLIKLRDISSLTSIYDIYPIL